MPSLVIKCADDLTFKSGLGVTNRRFCIAKPLNEISKSQMWVFVFCKVQRKKEFVVSEFVHGCVNKFLLMGSYRMLVV